MSQSMAMQNLDKKGNKVTGALYLNKIRKKKKKVRKEREKVTFIAAE